MGRITLNNQWLSHPIRISCFLIFTHCVRSVGRERQRLEMNLLCTDRHILQQGDLHWNLLAGHTSRASARMWIGHNGVICIWRNKATSTPSIVVKEASLPLSAWRNWRGFAILFTHCRMLLHLLYIWRDFIKNIWIYLWPSWSWCCSMTTVTMWNALVGFTHAFPFIIHVICLNAALRTSKPDPFHQCASNDWHDDL